jgi:hypothetical protein
LRIKIRREKGGELMKSRRRGKREGGGRAENLEERKAKGGLGLKYLKGNVWLICLTLFFFFFFL